MDNHKFDSLFEAAFRQAAIDNFEDELDNIPSNEELADIYKLSEHHERRMKKLFAWAERRKTLRVIVKTGQRAAVVALIILTLLSAFLLSSQDVRAAVSKIIIEWFDTHTKFTSSEQVATEFVIWEPSYITEGFEEIDRSIWEQQSLHIYYQSEDGPMLNYGYSPADNSVSVNNENVNYYTLYDNGYTYHIFESTIIGDTNNIVWEMLGYRFKITSELSINELILIAQSVVEKN